MAQQACEEPCGRPTPEKLLMPGSIILICFDRGLLWNPKRINGAAVHKCDLTDVPAGLQDGKTEASASQRPGVAILKLCALYLRPTAGRNE